MKIAFISEFPPSDKKALSGTLHKCSSALSIFADIKWIPVKRTFLGRIIQKIGNIFYQLREHRFIFRLTDIGSRLSFRVLDKNNALEECDAIVAYFCLPVVRHLKISKPIIYLSDASFPVLLDYYPYYSGLSTGHKKKIFSFEKKAYNVATQLIFASNWAASGAKILGINDDKIEVIEFGANLDEKDIKYTPKLFHLPLRLLWVGVDWERKGGKIAVETVEWLNKNGIPAILNVVGAQPKETNEWVKYWGFKNKNIPNEYHDLINIFINSDIFIMPTKAECAGIVFSEASGFGLPILTFDTGGIGNYVINNVNGIRLPLDAIGTDFGYVILSWAKENKLERLSQLGRELYLSTLNYKVWQKRMQGIIQNIVNK